MWVGAIFLPYTTAGTLPERRSAFTPCRITVRTLAFNVIASAIRKSFQPPIALGPFSPISDEKRLALLTVAIAMSPITHVRPASALARACALYSKHKAPLPFMQAGLTLCDMARDV